jgi:hypothetical protein
MPENNFTIEMEYSANHAANSSSSNLRKPYQMVEGQQSSYPTSPKNLIRRNIPFMILTLLIVGLLQSVCNVQYWSEHIKQEEASDVQFATKLLAEVQAEIIIQEQRTVKKLTKQLEKVEMEFIKQEQSIVDLLENQLEDMQTEVFGIRKQQNDLLAEHLSIPKDMPSPKDTNNRAETKHQQPQQQQQQQQQQIMTTYGLPISASCKHNEESIAQFCTANFSQSRCQDHNLALESLVFKEEINDDNIHKCKTLWFAGFHEGKDFTSNSNGGNGNSSCTTDEDDQYVKFYAAALDSALKNAKDVLQPVLILGRYGLSNENSTDLSKIGRWAESKSVKVIVWPRLSFQDHVTHKKPQAAMGPYMRLDIPQIIEEHHLWSSTNGICQDYVLYTDSDVVFANPITHHDMKSLKDQFLKSDITPLVMYGREYGIHPNIQNTGVMIMNIPEFIKEWPSILNHATSQPNFPGHDQIMLNDYFSSKSRKDSDKMRILLPLYWNWKSYWKLEPSTYDQIKIIHFHGPKPGRLLGDIANCNFGTIGQKNHLHTSYDQLIKHGICCDQGKSATWALQLFEDYTASIKTHMVC